MPHRFIEVDPLSYPKVSLLLRQLATTDRHGGDTSPILDELATLGVDVRTNDPSTVTTIRPKGGKFTLALPGLPH